MAWTDVEYEVSPDGQVIATVQHRKTGESHAIVGLPDDVDDDLFRLIEEDNDWEQVGVHPMPKGFRGANPPRDEYNSPPLVQKEYQSELDPEWEPPKRPAELQEERLERLREQARHELEGWEIEPSRQGQRSGPKTPDATVESAMRYRERIPRFPLVREMGDVEMKHPWGEPSKVDAPAPPLRTPQLDENNYHFRPFFPQSASVDDETLSPIRQRAVTGRG